MEYKTVFLNVAEIELGLENEINKWAKDGWKLKCLESYIGNIGPLDGSTRLILVFKK